MWGPHGLGKTAVAAWAVLTFAAAHDGKVSWKVVTTASVWRQLTEYLWPEIWKWAPLFGFAMDKAKYKLEGVTGHAFPVASDVPESIEGAHAEAILYVLDEAKLIPSGIWLAAESALATGEGYALALSTPGMPGTYFHKIATGQIRGWWRRHVTLEEAIAEGRVSRAWAERMAETWKRDSVEYRRHVLGEWAEDATGGLFSASDIYACISGENPGKPVCIGVDIAAGGGDLTAVAVRCERGISEVVTWDVPDLMQTTGKIAEIMRKLNVPAVIDTTGIGAGVFARLREQGFPALPFVAAERADLSGGLRRWYNRRAQAYCALAEAIAERKITLPADDELISDLLTVTTEIASDGSIKIASKKGLERSPDRADAVMMAWAFELLRTAPVRWAAPKRVSYVLST